jgi:predicted transcriptional regulator
MAAARKQPLAAVLGPLESEVMEVIWDLGEATVRDVWLKLNAAHPVAYTTVMTTMSRLADKRVLSRSEEQPAHRYSPRVSREQYAHSTVESVVDWLVTRFPDPAVTYFLDRVEKEDEKIIERLRRAIEEREAKDPGE